MLAVGQPCRLNWSQRHVQAEEGRAQSSKSLEQTLKRARVQLAPAATAQARLRWQVVVVAAEAAAAEGRRTQWH